MSTTTTASQDVLARQKLMSRNASYTSSRPVSFVKAPTLSDDDFTDSVSDSDYDSDDDFNSPPYDMSNITIARAVPALPVKSAQRVSRFLDIQTLEIKKADAEASPVITSAPPHDIYLSSEEDVSSSADDFSDCGSLSDSETSQKSPMAGSTQELTARSVAVVFKGKPSMVEMTRQMPAMPPPRSSARLSTSAPRLRRIGTDSAIPRQAALNAQAAKNARYSVQVTQDDAASELSHRFLNTDPFPNAPESRRRDSLQGSRSLPQESLRRSATTSRSRSKSTGRDSNRSSSPSCRSLRSVTSLALLSDDKSQPLTRVREELTRPAAPVKSYTAPPNGASKHKSKRLSIYEAPSVFENAAPPPAATSYGGTMSRLRAGLLGRRHKA